MKYVYTTELNIQPSQLLNILDMYFQANTFN